MARTIEFSFDGTVLGAELNKVDRSKLYGSIQIDTRSVDGGRCSLATLASDGRTLVPHGGTSLGYLNRDGEWVPRGDLVATDLSGNELAHVESSFNAPIELGELVSLDNFLDHGIRLVYLLDLDLSGVPGLADQLTAGAIFGVPFSYRGGVVADPAFLMADDDGLIWFLIGDPHEVNSVGLEQAAVCIAGEVDDSVDDSDDGDPLDFGMM